jgi:hypothetical protein
MGEVHRARDTRLGREVAIKVLPGESATEPVRLRPHPRKTKARHYCRCDGAAPRDPQNAANGRAFPSAFAGV